MRLSRFDLWRGHARQVLFLDDPRTWPVWETVAWLLPVMMFGLIPLAVYVLWRLGEIR